MFSFIRTINRKTNWLLIILLIITIGLIGFSILVHQKLINNASDDSYIHIRIASNLALYSHPYYNISDKVFATSSFIWTVMLGIAFKIFPQSPYTVSVINAILWSLSGIVYGLIAYQLDGNRNRIISFFIATTIVLSMLFDSSYSLMETPLAILLLGFVSLCFLTRFKFLYILIGLMPHVRYELVVYLIIFLFISIFIIKDNLLNILFQLIIVNLPILILELLFFNTIIPNTIIAKSALYDIPIINNLILILQSINPVHLSNLSVILSGIVVFVFVLFEIIPSGIKLVRTDIQSKLQINFYTIGTLLSGSIILMTLYIFSGSMIFPWYNMLYAIPFFFSLFCFSIIMKKKVLLYFVILLTIKNVYSGISLFEQSLWSEISPPRTQTAARVLNYIKIGQWLQKKYPDATVMTSEIGGLGYGFQGYIYDGAGLITPEAIQYHPLSVPDQRKDGSIGSIPKEFIASIKPDIIVSYDYFNKGFLGSELTDEYKKIEKPALREEDSYYFTNVFGDKFINIFIRNDFLNNRQDN